MRLADAYARHYDTDDLARTTRSKYRGVLRLWERHTPDPDVRAIDNATLAGFRTSCLEAGLAPATINAAWGDVRSFLRALARPELGNPFGAGILDALPAMKPVKCEKRRPKRIDLVDLSRFYVVAAKASAPRHVEPGRWWRALIVTAYLTGLRRSDLFSLTWDKVNLDLDRGTIDFTASKTWKHDLFPLHPVAVAHLEQIRGPGRGRVFHGATTGGKFSTRWNHLLDEADVAERFTLHDVRRTAASEIDRVDRGLGKVFLQHSPRNVTEVSYLNAAEELRDAVEAMRLPDGFRAGPRMTERRESKEREARIRTDEFSAPAGINPARVEWQTWGFRLDGSRWLRLTGKRLDMLRLLVEADGGVDAGTITRTLGLADEKRVQSAVSHLRARLRELFGLPSSWDPVPCVARGGGGSWTVHLPADVKIPAPEPVVPPKRRRRRLARLTIDDVATLTPTGLGLLKALRGGPCDEARFKMFGIATRLDVHLAELRAWLRGAYALPDEWNPIACVDGQWTLNLR